MSFPIVDTSKIGAASDGANLGLPIMPTATTANNNSNNSEIDSSNNNNNINKNFIENHNNSNEIINFANFNQDFSCISVGYKNGYKVYNCDPFGKALNKNDSGSIGIVEMLFSSSLLAIVGMGDQNSLSPRRLKIINTKRQTTICELTFPNSILSVKLNRERLIVLLEETIYIYDITNMRLLHTIEIPLNPNGLIALSPSTENNYLAYPSSQKSSPIGSVGATGINSINNNNLKNNSNNNSINNTNNANSSSNSIISSNSNLFDSSNNVINGNGTGKDVDGNNNNNSNNNNNNNVPSLSVNSGGSDTGGLTNAGTTTTGGGVSGVGNTTNNNNLSVRNGDVIIFNAKTLQPLSVIEAHKTSSSNCIE
ncbi:unnamed protein product [[Candida] boidinii]|nr:unnamed protein product [[Candida] boidinii]